MHGEGVSLIDCFTPTTNQEEEKLRPFSQESSIKVRDSKNEGHFFGDYIQQSPRQQMPNDILNQQSAKTKF